MNTLPRVAALHDLSGFGKCSLTAALPVLSVMGAEVCPLPTAVLSNQTGFPTYEQVDFTSHLSSFLTAWEKNGASFSSIYTGFLNGSSQIGLARALIETFASKDTLVIIDPVLGDEGKLFSIFDEEMCSGMRALVEKASLITPNITEACLLAEESMDSVLAGGIPAVSALAKKLSGLGPDMVVITGFHHDDQICNCAYIKKSDESFSVCAPRLGGYFSGTGDLLTSVLCGGLLRGQSLKESLHLAVKFLSASIADTVAAGTPGREGVAFEPHLSLLLPTTNG